MSTHIQPRELIRQKLREFHLSFPHNNNLDQFVQWIEGDMPGNLTGTEGKDDHGHNPDGYMVFLLMFLYRQFRVYARKALQDSALSNPDSYAFLRHLQAHGAMRKMDLINMHFLEGPTGVEIIKRLHRKGFVKEQPDPDDRRARLVEITPTGAGELARVQPRMEEVFAIMASLPGPQISEQIIPCLEMLYRHHASHYPALRKLGLEEVKAQILPSSS